MSVLSVFWVGSIWRPGLGDEELEGDEVAVARKEEEGEEEDILIFIKHALLRFIVMFECAIS